MVPEALHPESPPEAPLAALYRAELARADGSIGRLAVTTNWALIASGALAALAFLGPASPHELLLLALGLASAFALVEARRYRYFDVWMHRVRLLETGYWAAALRGEPAETDALKELAQELSRPHLRLSFTSALARRVRPTYGLLLMALSGLWCVKLHLHPVPSRDFAELLARARVGAAPGALVFTAVALLAALVVAFYVASWLTHAPSEELRARPGLPLFPPWRASLRRWASKARDALGEP